MKTAKLKTTLTHDEVCHALIEYIARDKDERITGTPMLFISTNQAHQVTSCELYFDVKEKEETLVFEPDLDSDFIDPLPRVLR